MYKSEVVSQIERKWVDGSGVCVVQCEGLAAGMVRWDQHCTSPMDGYPFGFKFATQCGPTSNNTLESSLPNLPEIVLEAIKVRFQPSAGLSSSSFGTIFMKAP